MSETSGQPSRIDHDGLEAEIPSNNRLHSTSSLADETASTSARPLVRHVRAKPMNSPASSSGLSNSRKDINPEDRIAAPEILMQTTDLACRVDLYPTGWQAALKRSQPPRTHTLDVQRIKPSGGRSIRVSPLKLKVVSYVFPESPHWLVEADQRHATGKDSCQTKADSLSAKSEPQTKSSTRVKPPKDVVKLEDRLYYMLQPPLESLFSNERITFPFEPFPYQFQGMAFLYPRHAAVLADEMGLGKTMQAISSIRLLLHAREVKNVLLVCPKPLVTNWQREFRTWAPEIPIGTIEGDSATRRWQWQHPATPVKIANYELVLRDEALFEELKLHYDLVVLDEAQRVKNKNSTTSQVVRGIPRYRSWALTGTPIENSLDDLFGIFEFLGKGLGANSSAQQLAAQVRDWVLRRTKDNVLEDLPPKLYRDAELDLSPEQYDSYRTAEEEGIIRLNDMGDQITVQHVFELVLRLKQICNFDPATGASSKLDRLEADLAEVAASGQKAIVFSQWVDTLDRLKEKLSRLNPLEYHGRIPTAKRDPILQRFKEDPKHSVLLMSYGAGSVGLNLQFCRYVFLYDRWWNPAVEDQAINRAHRIGAAGSVTVTRMLTVGTIEERINQVLEEKRALFDTLFSQTGTPRSVGLTQDEIFGLFNLRTPKGPLSAPRQAG